MSLLYHKVPLIKELNVTCDQVRKFGRMMVIGTVIYCILRQYIFTTKYVTTTMRWYDRHGKLISGAVTLGFWKPDNITSKQINAKQVKVK